MHARAYLSSYRDASAYLARGRIGMHMPSCAKTGGRAETYMQNHACTKRRAIAVTSAQVRSRPCTGVLAHSRTLVPYMHMREGPARAGAYAGTLAGTSRHAWDIIPASVRDRE